MEPGGGPPPLPSVPPERSAAPPGSSPESPSEPPRRSPADGRAALVGGLAVALAVSLAVNAILALRVKDESDRQTDLQTQVANLRAELDALRRQQPASGVSVLDRIAAAVEELRDLRFKTRVKPELLTDEQLRARVAELYRKDNPRAEVDKDDAVLTALGLLGPRDDLFEILLGVQTEQVAGFYDTDTKKLVVGGDAKNPSPLDQVLLAHELTHAVTDQRFDIGVVDKLSDENKDDEASAYLALIEGDATVTMFQYAQKYLTPSQQQDVDREASSGSTERLLAAPPVIRQALLFPYQEGQKFVTAVLENGGLAALNKAYADPPTSTEQILHPSRYLSRRDEPTAVDMPELVDTMGSGWTELPAGGIGEFDVQLLIDQYLSSNEARSTASGWDGGRYVAADSSRGTVVAIETAWDSVTEAREAASTMERWLPARYAGGRDYRVDGVTGRGWESSAGAGAVTRNGTRVLLVVGPDRDSVERARSAFSGF